MAKKLHKNTENLKRNNQNQSNVHKTLNLDNCVRKQNSGHFLVIFLLNSVTLLLKIFKNFGKIDENFCQKL